VDVLLGIGLLSALAYGVYRAAAANNGLMARRREAANQRASARQRSQADLARQRAEQIRRRQQQLRERQEQVVASRRLQLALRQIQQCPDFRRAASFATQARGLPLAFRQRKFRRFRQSLVQHFSRRLAAGQESQALVESLAPLVEALGVSAFEADYIRVEAERVRRAPQRRQTSYAEQFEILQRQHEDRLTVLRNLAGIDADTREQLLESEMTRFREELLGIGQEPQSST